MDPRPRRGTAARRARPTRSQDTLQPVGDVAKEQLRHCSCRSSGSPSGSSSSCRAASSTSRSAIGIARAATACSRQTHGNTRLEISWTIAPAVVLAVVMVPTVSLIWDLAREPEGERALNIRSRATSGGGGSPTPTRIWSPTGIADHDRRSRWWSRRLATSTRSSRGRGCQGQLRRSGLPGDPLVLGPQLFGKQDVVPSRTNHIQFSVDEAGTYTGQCAGSAGCSTAA